MSAHAERIDNHVVHTNLEITQRELDVIKKNNNTPEATEVLARIMLVVKNYSVAMDNCNKELISTTWLDDASKALININSYLTNYTSNKDVSSLRTNCNTQIDILLNLATRLNCVKSNQHLRGIIASQNEYAEFVDAQNQLLSVEVKELEDKIEKFKDYISEYQAESQKSLQKFKNEVDSEKTRLDGFATTYQQQMQADQNSFSAMNDMQKKSFTESQDERKKVFLDNIKSLDEDVMSVITEYKKKFDDYQKQVENIVGVVNTNMFSHKYKEVADDAKKRAKIWHIIAIVLMVIVGFLQYTRLLSQ